MPLTTLKQLPTMTTTLRNLVPPLRIAQALDWKPTHRILTVSAMNTKTFDVAVASHPSSMQLLKLPPITRHESVETLIHDWTICAILVHWPVQDSGYVGAACGRTLYALERWEGMQSRPLCLWTSVEPYDCDSWGRHPQYAIASSKSIHLASLENYPTTPRRAVDVWKEFQAAYWPKYKLNNAAFVPDNWLDLGDFQQEAYSSGRA